jgi:hypothetical protein
LETDVENAASCPYEGDNDIRSLYLAGSLPDKDAAAFEEHYFACERCAEAVETGSNLRSVFGNVPVRSVTPPARVTRTWLPLAAAAAVAFLGLAVWQLARRGPVEGSTSVHRSAEAGELRVQVEWGAEGSLQLAWTPHPAAARYVVRILARDGASVWSGESQEARLAVAASALPAPTGPLEVQVEAIDTMERVVATSPTVLLGTERR